MNFSIQFDDDTITVTNNGPDVTLNLGPGNSIDLPNGASVQPPNGTYWHIQSYGGSSLEGTHGPLEMPSGSSPTFKVDNVNS